MQQDTDQMVTGRTGSIQRAIQQKRGVQDRSDHVVKMADEGLPSVKMRILKDCQ